MERGNGNQGSARTDHHVGATAREVAEHASAITRLELELATLELKRKAISFGVGAALGGLAALLAIYAVGFAFASAAAGIATVLPLWASLLIVTGILVLLAVIVALIARSLVQRATPPVPKTAIREARLTQAAIRR
jgi:membrane protein